ncbi:uncharacterized protein V6R79_014425 [Siganus canaliculatus]
MEFVGDKLVRCTADISKKTEAKHKQHMTLHCQQCNTILGNSFGICGEIKYMDSIMCIKVTYDVVVGDADEAGNKGDLANCIYSSLHCRCCRSAVGKVIHSAPPHLASVRSIFLLDKANISCYILKSSSLVEASTLSFDMKPLRESLDETKQQFEALLAEMTRVKRRQAERKHSLKSV